VNRTDQPQAINCKGEQAEPNPNKRPVHLGSARAHQSSPIPEDHSSSTEAARRSRRPERVPPIQVLTTAARRLRPASARQVGSEKQQPPRRQQIA